MRRLISCVLVVPGVVAAMAALLGRAPAQTTSPAGVCHSPLAVAFSPDGKTLAVSDHTAASLAMVDVAGGKLIRQETLIGKPGGVAWDSGGGRVFVVETGCGTVAEVSAAGGIVRRLSVGGRPSAVAVASKAGVLLVTDAARSALTFVDIAGGKPRARVTLVHQPDAVAVTPNESMAVVANTIPLYDARGTDVGAAVSLIDIAKAAKLADIVLPAGSTNLRGVAIAPDGKWAYVAHTLGRYALPTTQIERGWINTNALSVIDLSARKHYATVLLDLLTEGAADPWGVAMSPDGAKLHVALAGVHQVATLDVKRFHDLLAKAPSRELLASDLRALHANKVMTRTPLAGNGPRGLAISPDGKMLAAAMYFSGQIVLTDALDASAARVVSLGDQPPLSDARRGEMIFHDGTYSFQKWLSCATCHPGGRADGLNWDLLNDGIGNPKNTKSLVWSDRTPPVMAMGVRASADIATEKGFQFIQFVKLPQADMDAVKAHLKSMEPEPSPFLVEGKLSPGAVKGKALFEDATVGCARCHPAPLYTDLKTHDVGTAHAQDGGVKGFDNPTLIELWRTAPYLHDGSARTLRDVITEHNKGDKHGKTSHLSAEQIDALVEYMLSL
jgi:DNA-binding beta-propeller fold protein YncE